MNWWAMEPTLVNNIYQVQLFSLLSYGFDIYPKPSYDCGGA